MLDFKFVEFSWDSVWFVVWFVRRKSEAVLPFRFGFRRIFEPWFLFSFLLNYGFSFLFCVCLSPSSDTRIHKLIWNEDLICISICSGRTTEMSGNMSAVLYHVSLGMKESDTYFYSKYLKMLPGHTTIFPSSWVLVSFCNWFSQDYYLLEWHGLFSPNTFQDVMWIVLMIRVLSWKE